jgi:hypothetical protein
MKHMLNNVSIVSRIVCTSEAVSFESAVVSFRSNLCGGGSNNIFGSGCSFHFGLMLRRSSSTIVLQFVRRCRVSFCFIE